MLKIDRLDRAALRIPSSRGQAATHLNFRQELDILINTNSFDRRSFVQVAGAACISNVLRPDISPSLSTRSVSGPCPLRMGLVVWVADGQSIEDAIQDVHTMGLQTCQIGFVHLTAGVAEPVKNALKKYGVEATAFSEHGPGQRVFNFYEGPETIGIVPPETRDARIRNLQLAADIASECGIPAIHTHCGFIPENPNEPLYTQAVSAVKKIGDYCKERGLQFLCETGEETPVTLLRLIEDVGLDNVFVNLDVANLIMYGNGNPVDAMDVIGHLVRGIHAKDGLFPTDARNLGREAIIGQGRVNFPAVIERLKQVDYQGPITIERETQGAHRREDILQSKVFLENLIGKAYR
jgi:sugar phosphate isomerase/epimerase